jgi:hypothetical protein
MAKRALSLLLCCVCSSAAPVLAQSGRPAPAPAAASTTVPDLPRDLARLFPADTVVYVEFGELASVAGDGSAPGPFENMMGRALRRESPVAAVASAFTAAERRLLVASTVVFAMVWPDSQRVPVDEDSVGEAYRAVCVLRAESDASAAKLQGPFLRFAGAGSSQARRPRVEKLGDRDVTVLAESDSPKAFAHAAVGRHIICGDLDGVLTVIAGASRPLAQSLSAQRGYGAAVSRLAGRRQAFGYVNTAAMAAEAERAAKARHEAAAANAGGRVDEAPLPPPPPPSPFPGFGAPQSFAFAVGVANNSLRLQMLLELDRAKAGIAALLADPPDISVRSADFVPAGTDVFVAGGVDLQAAWDLLQAGDQPTTTPFGAWPKAQAAAMEANLMSAHSLSLRNDVLGAFGSEMAVASGRDFAVAVFEVRRPEVFRTMFERYRAGLAGRDSAEPPERREYNGAEMWRFGQSAWALLDGFAVSGPARSVERAVDARRSGRTFGSGGALALRTRLASRGLGAVFFLSPEYFRPFFKDRLLDAPELRGLDAFVDPNCGLVCSVEGDGASILIDAETQAEGPSAPSTPQAGCPECERAALGALRTISFAEASFHSEKGRYGTYQELVEAQALDADLMKNGEHEGYRFSVEVLAREGMAAGGFAAVAIPVRYGETGVRSFYIGDDFRLRARDRRGAAATAEDAPLALDEEAVDAWGSASVFSLPYTVPLFRVIAELGALTATGKEPGGADEGGAIDNLRTIGSAQATYFAQKERYGSFEELVEAGTLDEGYANGAERGGYRFWLETPDPGRFVVTAAPVEYGKAGVRSFYMAEDFVVRAADRGGADATASDPPIGAP